MSKCKCVHCKRDFFTVRLSWWCPECRKELFEKKAEKALEDYKENTQKEK